MCEIYKVEMFLFIQSKGAVYMTKVLLAGESWISSTTEYKGFDEFTSTKLEIGCVEFLDALRKFGHDVTHLKAHDVPENFPWTMDELNKYDVVILSDIGSNSFLLPNRVFGEGQRCVNRLDLLAKWVREGHGLMMAGGYLSFAGFEGKAHYHGTSIEDVLPVEISPFDDRAEKPQGVIPKIVSNHPIVNDLSPIPILLGYQKLLAKESSNILMKVDDNPLLIVNEVDKGRSIAFASDIAPHWAPEAFMQWSGYGQLFSNCVKWLSKEI